MNKDIEQMRAALAPHDPARDVRVDEARTEEALRSLALRDAPARRSPWRRRLMVGVPVSLAVTAAAVAGVTVVQPAGGPARIGTAQALAITERGSYLEVRIVDPYADPEVYREQFARYKLNVTLKVVPVSPSMVGKMVYYGEDTKVHPRVTPLDPDPACDVMQCQPGMRIPTDLRNPVTATFGRAPKPGERFEISGNAEWAGEPLEGVQTSGMKVGDLRRLARKRGVKIVKYMQEPPRDQNGMCAVEHVEGEPCWNYSEHVLDAAKVPDSWYVHDNAWSGKDPKTVTLQVAEWKD